MRHLQFLANQAEILYFNLSQEKNGKKKNKNNYKTFIDRNAADESKPFIKCSLRF